MTTNIARYEVEVAYMSSGVRLVAAHYTFDSALDARCCLHRQLTAGYGESLITGYDEGGAIVTTIFA